MSTINWGEIWSIASIILLIAYQVVIIVTVIILIMDNRKPEKTIAWVVILLLLPIVGLIFYIHFGRNLKKEKLLDRKSLHDDERIVRMASDQLNLLQRDELQLSEDVEEKKHIITFMLRSSKAVLSQYNKVDFYFSGEEKFKAVLTELEKAKHHIHLEYYVYEDDEIGNKIKEILIRKAKEGVEVRFIYDGVGSWGISKKLIKQLKKAGVEVYSFLPVRFPLLTSRVNYRNHRKILIIDGVTGYVGGMNVADRYLKGSDLGKWRDTHLRIEGDAVKALQLVFAVDWDFVSNQKLKNIEKYFPQHQVNEKHLVQIGASGPDSDHAYIMETFFAAIVTAKKNIYITTPYFLPNESILTALQTASLGGVDIRIIIPKKSDAYFVSFSSLSYVDALLEAGIKVYFYKSGFLHSKVMTVDGIFASVGTANMDYRSFEYNLEVNALIYDSEITGDLEKQFKKDMENSEQVNLQRWYSRSLKDRFKQSMARIFAPLF